MSSHRSQTNQMYVEVDMITNLATQGELIHILKLVNEFSYVNVINEAELLYTRRAAMITLHVPSQTKRAQCSSN